MTPELRDACTVGKPTAASDAAGRKVGKLEGMSSVGDSRRFLLLVLAVLELLTAVLLVLTEFVLTGGTCACSSSCPEITVRGSASALDGIKVAIVVAMKQGVSDQRSGLVLCDDVVLLVMVQGFSHFWLMPQYILQSTSIECIRTVEWDSL